MEQRRNVPVTARRAENGPNATEQFHVRRVGGGGENRPAEVSRAVADTSRWIAGGKECFISSRLVSCVRILNLSISLSPTLSHPPLVSSPAPFDYIAPKCQARPIQVQAALLIRLHFLRWTGGQQKGAVS
jgi:hypothetical protein